MTRVTTAEVRPSDRVAILGGGPGGYEAALVAAQLGAKVTVVDCDGVGGSAVLTDCVPSKTLIATSELMTELAGAPELGVSFEDHEGDAADHVVVDLARVNKRVTALAQEQSADIARRLEREDVRVVRGHGSLAGPGTVHVELHEGGTESIAADAVLVATGAAPRTLPTAQPDGERILTWEQVYDLTELADPADRGRVRRHRRGVRQRLHGPRHRRRAGLLARPGAARARTPTRPPCWRTCSPAAAWRCSRARGCSRWSATATRSPSPSPTAAPSPARTACSRWARCPAPADLGLEEAGVKLDDRGFVRVDRVSRTTARGIYAAGDCTGVLMLASVAAMQGRIAMWHFLGDAVTPLDLRKVSSNVFTAPEIATVGWQQPAIDAGEIEAETIRLDLAGNPRAKMQGVRDGFVKLFCRPGTGIVIGGVVVGPRASELIHPVSIAVAQSLTADALAHAFTVYPSMSGSIAEAARRLHHSPV